jgi:hypothetical protein
MSLRSFHIFFITLSALFALGFGLWLAGVAGESGNPLWYLAVAGCLLCASAMAVYAVRFARKTRDMVPTGSL